MGTVRAVIFDLDGTLLDTLPDLVAITNKALSDLGFPTHSRDEILSYIGLGAESLISQALPAGTSQEDLLRTLDHWRALYPVMGDTLTSYFLGIEDMLANLRRAGIKTAVLSNKFDAGTQQVVTRYFPGLFDIVHGEGPEIPRKPDPTGLLRTLSKLACRPQEAAYVGDSPTDMEVADRAGVQAWAVTWGYNPPASLIAAGADKVVQAANDIVRFACG